MKPMTTKEFDAKYQGCTFREIVEHIGKFGEIKYAHTLKVYNQNKEVVYKEWYICSE